MIYTYKYPEAEQPLCQSPYNPTMPPSANPETYCSPSPYYDQDNKRILGGLMNSIDPMQRANMGLCRKPYIVGTTQVVCKVFSIQFLADSVIDFTGGGVATIGSTYSNGDADLTPLVGVTIAKGTCLFLQLDALKLVSGLAIAYADPFRI